MEEKLPANIDTLSLTEEILCPKDAMTTCTTTQKQYAEAEEQAASSNEQLQDPCQCEVHIERPVLPAWKGQPEVPLPILAAVAAKKSLLSVPRHPVTARLGLPVDAEVAYSESVTQEAILKNLEVSQEDERAGAMQKMEENVFTDVDDSWNLEREGPAAVVVSQENEDEHPLSPAKSCWMSTHPPAVLGPNENPHFQISPPHSPSNVPPNLPHALIKTPTKNKITKPVEIVLSSSSWGNDTHPVLTELIQTHLESYFKEGGTGNAHSQTVDLVIHRLFTGHEPIIVIEDKRKGQSKGKHVYGLKPERMVLDNELVMQEGPYRSRLVSKVRECFVHAKEQHLQKQRQQEQPQQVSVSNRPPTFKPEDDPLICDEQIEPYLDPAILFHQQQEAQRLLQQHQPQLRQHPLQTQRVPQQKRIGPRPKTSSALHCGPSGQQPKAPVRPMVQPTASASSVHPALTVPTGGTLQTCHVQQQQQAVLPFVPGPNTPDRNIATKRDMDETPVIANTKKKHRTQNMTQMESIPLTAKDETIVPKEAKTKIKSAIIQPTRLIEAGKQVLKPVVRVDGLTYDWSSLNLDGTAAWNRLLTQRVLDNPGTKKTVTQVTAIDTYRLMHYLKDSLQTIMPAGNSPLHEAMRATPQASLQQTEEESSKQRFLRLSNCPEDLRPLFPRLAVVYNEMVAQDCLPPGASMQQRYYQYMTAAELREHMIAAEQDVVVLAGKEERVLRTAKQLGLFGKRNRSDEVNIDDDKSVGDASTKPVFWQQDFAALLKQRDVAKRYLMVHDQW